MSCAELAELAPLYLSGELDSSRAAAFEAHLQACPECALGTEQQRETDARLRSGVLAEDVDCGPLEARIHRRIAGDSAARSRLLLLAASLAAVLILAGVASRTAPSSARLYQDAAQDHRREIIDGQRRTWISDASRIQSLATSQGVPASAVDALARAGYRFEGGRICLLDGHLFLHLVYAAGGQRFSVFLRKGELASGTLRETANGRRVYAAQFGQDEVAALADNRLTFLFVATNSKDRAVGLARSAAAVL